MIEQSFGHGNKTFALCRNGEKIEKKPIYS